MKRLLLLLLLLSTPAYATTYYVNKAGSNANSCATAQSTTDSSAKLTIAGGVGCLSASDTLIIGDGTYAETYIYGPNDSALPNGTAGNPTIIKAENKQFAIIRATSQIAGGGGYGVISLKGGARYIRFDGLTFDSTNICGNGGLYYTSSNAGTTWPLDIEAINNKFISSPSGLGPCNQEGGVDHQYGINWNSNTDAATRYLVNNNTFIGCTSYCIYSSSGASNTITNNVVTGQVLASGRIFTLYGFFVRGSNNIVTGNWVDGTPGRCMGFDTNGGTTNDDLIANNVVSNCAETGIEIGSGTDNALIYFNTVYGSGGPGIHLRSGSTDSTVRNNILYLNSDTIDNDATGTTSSNNLTTNPSFVDTVAPITDFHLTSTSAALPPCGTNIPAVTVDKDGITRGNPPSCGAYEVPSGSDPGGNLVEDFESYAATTSINGLNGGTGWTQTWQLLDGTATVENTSCLTGKAFRSTAVVSTEVRRFFTAKSGEFTFQVKMCMDTTAHNNLVGISLIDNTGGYQIAAWFTASGNLLIYDNGTTTGTLSSYSANTSYRVRFNFDTVNQPGKVRISINDVAYTDWISTVSSFSSISGLYFNNYSTSAHTFEMDDINSEAGPPQLPPGPTTPVGIKARIRGRI